MGDEITKNVVNATPHVTEPRNLNKLGLKVRNSADRLAWFEYNGQTVVRTKRSHGNKEQPGSMIRQQLKLNDKQLAGPLKCDVLEIHQNRRVNTGSPYASTAGRSLCHPVNARWKSRFVGTIEEPFVVRR
jgi:hypothetical protein